MRVFCYVILVCLTSLLSARAVADDAIKILIEDVVQVGLNPQFNSNGDLISLDLD